MVIRLPSLTTLGDECRSVTDILMCSRFNSSIGIKLPLDQPMNVRTLLNVACPAVLCQYFGRKVDESSNVWLSIEHRYTYDSGICLSSVGMDPYIFVAHPFTLSLDIIASEFHSLINFNI